MSPIKLGSFLFIGSLLVPTVSMAEKSREEVKQELRRAQQDGTLFELNRNTPKVPQTVGPRGTRLEAKQHGSGGKSREEAGQESRGIQQDGSVRETNRSEPRASENADPEKTREEVIGDYLSMTPEEKQRLQELYPGG